MITSSCRVIQIDPNANLVKVEQPVTVKVAEPLKVEVSNFPIPTPPPSQPPANQTPIQLLEEYKTTRCFAEFEAPTNCLVLWIKEVNNTNINGFTFKNGIRVIVSGESSLQLHMLKGEKIRFHPNADVLVTTKTTF